MLNNGWQRLGASDQSCDIQSPTNRVIFKIFSALRLQDIMWDPLENGCQGFCGIHSEREGRQVRPRQPIKLAWGTSKAWACRTIPLMLSNVMLTWWRQESRRFPLMASRVGMIALRTEMRMTREDGSMCCWPNKPGRSVMSKMAGNFIRIPM